MIVEEGVIMLDMEVCEECRQAEEAFQEWKKDCTEKRKAFFAAKVFSIMAVVMDAACGFYWEAFRADNLPMLLVPALFTALPIIVWVVWWLARGNVLRGFWFGVSTDSDGKNHIHHTTGSDERRMMIASIVEQGPEAGYLFVPTPGMRGAPSGEYYQNNRPGNYPDTSSVRIEAAESFSFAKSLARALHTVTIKYGEQLGMSEGATVNVLTERVFDQSFALLHKFPLDWLSDAAAAEAKEEGVALGLITLANCMKRDPRASQLAADGRIVLTALINALPRFRFWVGKQNGRGVEERVERMYGEQVAYSINRRG